MTTILIIDGTNALNAKRFQVRRSGHFDAGTQQNAYRDCGCDVGLFVLLARELAKVHVLYAGEQGWCGVTAKAVDP